MRIARIEPDPIAEIPCLVPQVRGRIAPGTVPVRVGRLEGGLPPPLAGLVLTSDLQAREPEGGRPGRPVGIAVAEALHRLGLEGRLPLARSLGVLLAGDLYTSPTLHQRFGHGDVTEVWDAFGERFRWVTGVLGNVDALPRRSRSRLALLDGDVVQRDGLSIGGVSGIAGPPKMPNRRPEPDFVETIARTLRKRPDILVLHEGPSVPRPALRGSEAVRRALRDAPCGLVVCGHDRWPGPLAHLRPDLQILNTDGSVVVLLP